MPELPEVEFAVRRLRRAIAGRRIVALRTHHRALARGLSAAHARRAVGRRVSAVGRRGKFQLIHLDDGATLLVHFRLNGDWSLGRSATALPAHARVSLDFHDGRRAVLVDSRALCTLTWHPASAPPALGLGPEPEDPTLDARRLRERLQRSRSAIKAALLDQAIVAGVGNIYAAEACWLAGISPRARADALSAARVARLLDGLRRAFADGHVNAARYHRGERTLPFGVYDREGEPCTRCGRAIRRIVQSGRSTYYCPGCQRR